MSEITADIRQQVSARITDLIDQLLCYSAIADLTAGLFGLGDNEIAIGLDFHNGKAHIGVTVGDVLPVGKVTASSLGAAFHQMASQAALGEFVIIIPAPAEFVY